MSTVREIGLFKCDIIHSAAKVLLGCLIMICLQKLCQQNTSSGRSGRLNYNGFKESNEGL